MLTSTSATGKRVERQMVAVLGDLQVGLDKYTASIPGVPKEGTNRRGYWSTRKWRELEVDGKAYQSRSELMLLQPELICQSGEHGWWYIDESDGLIIDQYRLWVGSISNSFTGNFHRIINVPVEDVHRLNWSVCTDETVHLSKQFEAARVGTQMLVIVVLSNIQL